MQSVHSVSQRLQLTSRFRAKLRMSASVIEELSCFSCLAAAAGESRARMPTNVTAYAAFIVADLYETDCLTWCEAMYASKLGELVE